MITISDLDSIAGELDGLVHLDGICPIDNGLVGADIQQVKSARSEKQKAQGYAY